MYIVHHCTCVLYIIVHVYCTSLYMCIVHHCTCELYIIVHVYCTSLCMCIVHHCACVLYIIVHVNCTSLYMCIVHQVIITSHKICISVNLWGWEYEIFSFLALRSHSSEPLIPTADLWPLTPTPTAMILPCLNSTRQDLSSEPQENIRKPIIPILTLNLNR